MKNILKALWELRDTHPFDLILHFLLGLTVFSINLWWFSDYLLAMVAAGNFIVAVELTQFDIFGFNKDLWRQCSILDYILDLVFGGLGVLFGVVVL